MTKAKEKEPLGPEIIQKMQDEVSIDRFLDNDPAGFTEKDYREMIEINRRLRAAQIAKDDK